VADLDPLAEREAVRLRACLEERGLEGGLVDCVPTANELVQTLGVPRPVAGLVYVEPLVISGWRS
jgi:hypothetical protein